MKKFEVMKNHIKKHCFGYGLLGIAIDVLLIFTWDSTLTTLFDLVESIILHFVTDPIRAGQMAVLPCVIIGMLLAASVVVIAIPAIYAIVWLFSCKSQHN